jgi:hypothetical protein
VTDRSDALRKVQGLMALAAPTSGASDEEKAAAERKAIALRLKHGISDHMLELAQASADMDGTEFFGHLLFFYGQHLAAHVEAIRAEIAAALTKVDKLDPLNRAEMYCKLYRELRDTVEGATWASSDIGLKPKRDAAVKALYQQIAYEYAASRDHSDRDSFGFERMQHEWARDRTASACGAGSTATRNARRVTCSMSTGSASGCTPPATQRRRQPMAQLDDDGFADLMKQLGDIPEPTDTVDFTTLTDVQISDRFNEVRDRLNELDQMHSDTGLSQVPSTPEGRALHSERAALLVEMTKRKMR